MSRHYEFSISKMPKLKNRIIQNGIVHLSKIIFDFQEKVIMKRL